MFKSFAVHGVERVTVNGQIHIEECADSEADYFGLYGYDAQGDCHWIADYTTRELAEEAQTRKAARYYTVQVFISGYAAPDGDDVEHFTSLACVKDYFRNCVTEAECYGAGYDSIDWENEAVIFKGLLDDVTDQYPDLIAKFGPRRGVILERC